MLTINENLEEALNNFINLLEENKYFEAHEVLEEAWHYLRLNNDSLQYITKGLINGAISLEHLKRDKKNALLKAKKVIKSYDRYRHLIVDTIIYYELFNRAAIIIDDLRAGKY